MISQIIKSEFWDMDFYSDIDTLWILQVAGVLVVLVGYQIFRLAWNRAVGRIASFRSLSPQRAITVRRAGQIMGRVTLAALIALIVSIEFQGILVILGAVSAAIGIAFFAQWSILSNVTTSIIMFWRFPIQIGDHIAILGIEDSAGVVQDMTPFFIILKDEQGNIITIPNNQTLLQNIVIYGKGNHTESDTESSRPDSTSGK